MTAKFSRTTLHLMPLLFVLTTLTVMLGYTQPAYAGNNGQQVSVWAEDPTHKLHRVVIEGRNQHNQPATWDSLWATKCHEYDDCSGVQAKNWWWKGNITIFIYQNDDDIAEFSCDMYITDRQHFSDWVEITFYNYPARGKDCYYDGPNSNR